MNPVSAGASRRTFTGSRPILALVTALGLTASAGAAGSVVIAGNGPELHTIERLARAFEKRYLGRVVEVRWDQDSDPVALVKTGVAQVAVTGQADSSLAATPIAWDGIAVIVSVANPTKEVTLQQVAAIFSGRATRWEQPGGRGATIQLITRPPNQNIRQGFEAALGIAGQIPRSARLIRSDQRAISTVAGNLGAVAYASLKPALDAVKYGVDVSLLQIDRVEAADQTVRDGRYKLRRPVLLLSTSEPDPVAEAFAGFALSPEGQELVGEMYTPYRAPEESKPRQGPPVGSSPGNRPES
jgi:phosphate transport system substrate-binding protein